TSDATTPTPTSSLGTGRTAVAISSGKLHTCAILDDGSVSCWGRGFIGALGNGGTSDATTPTPTSSLGTGRTAVAISSGELHTCAILDDGSVSCWGYGGNGQLGNGGTSDALTPMPTSNLRIGRTAAAISSGYRHTCAILDDGSVSCWGEGSDGQLGNGVTLDSPTPTTTSSLGAGRTVALSERDFNNDGMLNVFESTAPSLVTCNPGQYGFYMCVDAPLGKYVPSPGLRYASDCLAGTFQTSTGQQSCDDADAGHYADQLGQSSQTACLAGTYNTNTGSTTSTDCVGADAGHYVDSLLGTAQSSQTACSVGTYNPNTGSTTPTDCVDADVGYYVDQTGQSTQVQCQAGYTTLSTRSTLPTQCLSDYDGDATVDIYDDDDDDDGVLDTLDQCLTSDFDLSTDNDNDGCDDADEDTDDDNDGILDANDAFPLDASESVDTDNDGTGDNADNDDDGESVLDVNDDFPLDATESV
ncbi:MAG: hypothetical protein VXV71_05705, partial [Candidatus Thermoplasmatota archaeon]|nr:hypothetical protein [Candidatus Thermoplasmatota archaeon]